MSSWKNKYSHLKAPLARHYVHSQYMDIFGVVLILIVCYWRKFHQTLYYKGELMFNVTTDFNSLVNQGALPIGIFSMVAATISVLSGRFTAKQNNLGNVLNIVIAVTSGVLDYLFGNHSAVITYPVTFLVASYATYKWSTGIKIRPLDRQYYILVALSLVIAFSLVHLGFYLFGGKEGLFFRNTVGVVFGLSLAGTVSNAFKYKETWFNWLLYNIVQLIKNFLQMNFANVVKYIFYIISVIITYIDWAWNGDVDKEPSA